MTLTGILASPSQRRTFLLASGAVLLICILAVLAIAYNAPATPVWNAWISLFMSVLGSGVFAVVSYLFMSYFFVDPSDVAAQSMLLPQDIGLCLERVAAKATDYKIFVRTGRHFRATILPTLVKNACKARRPLRLEVILLDFRHEDVCRRYADFRKAASFDHLLWTTSYVQKEVLSTALALAQASREAPGLIDAHLFLSRRLSNFRIEGSSDEILVTREDPKDGAWRYLSTHREFAAFANEFAWIRDEAFSVSRDSFGLLPQTLRDMFGETAEIVELEDLAEEAMMCRSPYVR